MKNFILISVCLFVIISSVNSQTISDSHFGASAATWADSEGWSNIQNLGVHYMRVPIEIQKGVIVDVFFLTQYDNYVSSGQNNNIIMYGIINPKKNIQNQFPTATEFYNAVKTIIERYDGDGVNDMTGLINPIKNWEVCNEVTPETGLYQGFSMSDYLNFVDSSGIALNQACSDCQMFNGAQVGPPVSGSSQSFSTSTLDDLISGEGTGIIDAISYHDYLEYFEIDNAVNDFTTLGIQDRPVWLTEAGMQEEYIANNALTQDDNARLFVSSAAYAFMKGVSKIIYASVRAQTVDPDYVKWQSLLDPDSGSKRKIYFSYKKLIEKIDYFTAADTVTPHNGSTIFAVDFTVGINHVYMLWAFSNQTVNLELSSPYIPAVIVTNSVPNDTSGNFTFQELLANSGVVTLNIGPEAVYVEEETLPCLNEIINSISFIVYPNPADEYVILEIPCDAEIEIMNIMDQPIKQCFATEDKTIIDVHGLPAGMYFVKIKTGYGILLSKLIKK